MKILITGAAGFIGSAVAKALASQPEHHELLLIDHFDDGSTWANGKKRFFGTFSNLIGVRGRVLQMDITSADFMRTLADFAPEAVFHFAAISDTTVYDEAAIFRTNLNSFYPLLEHCERARVKLIYASSASVYGAHEGPCGIWRDEAPLCPYAASKLAMDEAARGSSAVGLRFFNVYGPGEAAKGATASMALQWAQQLAAGNRLKMFNDSASTFRDFVYIADVAGVCLRALAAAGGVYNVGSGQQASFVQLADAIAAALGCSYEPEWMPNPYAGRYQRSTLAELDGQLVRRENMRDIAAGCADYARYLRATAGR